MFPVPGAPTENERSIESRDWLFEREQLDEAVDRELGRRHGRLGDRIGPVDVLAVELAPALRLWKS